MIVYCVSYNYSGESAYFETLAEARLAAREWSTDEDPAEIARYTLISLPPRALAVRLLNGFQFVAKREVVT